MIKAVVSNGFIRNCISTTSKKVQEKGTAALFNATAPFYIKKTPRTHVRCGVPLMRGEGVGDAECEVGVKCYAYAG